ncbi:hypothetical protein H4582DRAFT_2129747 [Lactarius indigo]|nr:hypothetical protein H4582DRAFT_2129747 [Lactarius indigo]
MEVQASAWRSGHQHGGPGISMEAQASLTRNIPPSRQYVSVALNVVCAPLISVRNCCQCETNSPTPQGREVIKTVVTQRRVFQPLYPRLAETNGRRSVLLVNYRGTGSEDVCGCDLVKQELLREGLVLGDGPIPVTCRAEAAVGKADNITAEEGEVAVMGGGRKVSREAQVSLRSSSPSWSRKVFEHFVAMYLEEPVSKIAGSSHSGCDWVWPESLKRTLLPTQGPAFVLLSVRVIKKGSGRGQEVSVICENVALFVNAINLD